MTTPHYILPPHLLEEIGRSGDEQQRQLAFQLSQDNAFRTMRATASATLAFGVQRRASEGLLAQGKKLRRMVADVQGTTDLPGVVVRREGDGPVSDEAVNQAYDGLGYTHHFYLEVFRRHSIDDDGMPLEAIVHYSQRYANAFWDGRYMVFGDGDGTLFNRFTASLDIVGHELSHGVVENEAQLEYSDQSGALNESLADVFGSLVKQFANGQSADQADWLIGAGIFKPERLQGKALRSMKNPGTAYGYPGLDPLLGRDPQPAHMDQYVETRKDNGGVHINSGIPNRAFYLVATKIGGYAWKQAGRIWYETLRDPRLRATTTFDSFAYLTVDTAERLYGHSSDEAYKVRDAWAEVGIRLPIPV